MQWTYKKAISQVCSITTGYNSCFITIFFYTETFSVLLNLSSWVFESCSVFPLTASYHPLISWGELFCMSQLYWCKSANPASSEPRARHEWGLFMNVHVGKCAVKYRRIADGWDSLSSCRKLRKSQKGSDAVVLMALMTHESCWKSTQNISAPAIYYFF